MKFGICTAITQAAAVAAAGWDYVEESVQGLLRGTDAEWPPPPKPAVPILAANMLVPAALKITGPSVDTDALQRYIARVADRAAVVGTNTLVFGSGGARQVPDGFDRGTAARQITEFAAVAAAETARHGIDLVLEPLNRGECNIVNSIAEAMDYVRAVDRPNFWCLLDTYHFWLENEPLESLREAMPKIRHVHLADPQGRVAPGLSGLADYRPVFEVLKSAGYDRTMSFEGTAMNEFAVTAPRVLAFVKEQWASA
jgi:D-psicose/D-tagatose/L-ribulose 3-epimerase